MSAPGVYRGPLGAVGARGTVVLGLSAAAEALAVSVEEDSTEMESDASDEVAAGAV